MPECVIVLLLVKTGHNSYFVRVWLNPAWRYILSIMVRSDHDDDIVNVWRLTGRQGHELPPVRVL